MHVSHEWAQYVTESTSSSFGMPGSPGNQGNMLHASDMEVCAACSLMRQSVQVSIKGRGSFSRSLCLTW
jgi:hypothetical protein